MGSGKAPPSEEEEEVYWGCTFPPNELMEKRRSTERSLRTRTFEPRRMMASDVSSEALAAVDAAINELSGDAVVSAEDTIQDSIADQIAGAIHLERTGGEYLSLADSAQQGLDLSGD
ncbi:hypothetical protein COU80_00870, partial [Candidatus Peregrinibacteria bacterium CG10_big_fil_rev_8_21_14_0_10_55_24]